MRPLAPPADRVRQAAAQPSVEGVTSALTQRRGMLGAADEAGFLSRYTEWQGWARRFARQIGAASFNAVVVSDLCARCDVRVEHRDEAGEWQPFDDPRYVGIMEAYSNPLQGPDELVRLHAWHYQVAGEMYQVQRDGEAGGVEYGIYSAQAMLWDKPEPGLVTVKLTPDGKVDDGTAFAVPREQAIRFWVPDQEWQAYAWSPMAASIDDLKRYRALQRYALATADSAVAMAGVLWAPGEAFVDPPAEGADVGASEDLGAAGSALEEAYYSMARMRMSTQYENDVTSVAPALLHWDKDLGPPQWVQLANALDPNGIAHRQEALEDFARATTLPVTTILGGGVGDANHWSEWLASDKMFQSGVAPTMDRICHLDLTRAFLWPRAVMSGADATLLRDLRIGYDPTDVVVHPDMSQKALQLHQAGVLATEPTLEACGFDVAEEMVDPDERQWLLEVLAHGRLATQPAVSTVTPANAPIDSGNVVQLPPTRPNDPGGVTTPGAKVGPSAFGAAVEEPPPFGGRSRGDVRRAIVRLTKLRQTLGTRLLAEAEHAYEAALRQAGAKIQTRARSRTSGARQRQVDEALRKGEPLAPLLAVVGVKEHELLLHAFDTFKGRAIAELHLYRERAAAILADLAVDVKPPNDADGESAVDYMVTALTTMVRARLMQGDVAALTAAAPRMVPRARRAPSGGFDLPGLPDPDELSRAAAHLVRNALRVQEGRGDWQFPPTPDHMPLITFNDEPALEERVATAVDAEPTWTWTHGFYGEPRTVFEPHDALDGFNTTDREGDPELANDESWPDGDTFFPGDHDGCTCEWVISGEAIRELPEPEGPMPPQQQHQSTADVLARARERMAQQEKNNPG